MADYRDTPIEMPVLDRGGVAHNVKAYASLADAVIAAASKGGFIQLTEGTHAVADNLVIASDVQNAGGKIKPASGKTVVITGHIWPTAEGIADESAGGRVIVTSAAPEPTATASSAGNVFWDPPVQPSAIASDGDDFGGGMVVNATGTPPATWYALWDTLMASAPPSYVTRTLLGTDETGTYPVYKYVFAPEVYEKTIILTGFVHGNEPEGMLAIFRTLYHVVHDWRSQPQLAYLRHRVRIVVIPLVNPHGVANFKRKNGRGVDVNRNFDFRWAESGSADPEASDYRGVAPWSEAESRHVRDVILAYPDAVSLVDAHSLGADWGATAMFVPWRQSLAEDAFGDVVRWIDPDSYSWSYEDLSNVVGYAASLGLNAVNPEHSFHYSARRYDSAEITAAVRWIGNCIIRAAQYAARSHVYESSQPFSVHTRFRSQSGQDIHLPHVASEAAQQEIEALRLDFEVPSAGIVMLDIDLLVTGTTAGQTCWFTPILGQHHQPDWPITAIKHNDWGTYTYGPERQRVHLMAAIPVGRSRRNGVAGPSFVRIGLAAGTTDAAETMWITRYHARATFIPSGRGVRYRQFSATGRVDLGPDAMIQTYPPLP